MNKKRFLVPTYGASAIRILRAGFELNYQTITLYSPSDKYALHRYKADEAYLLHSYYLPDYYDEQLILSIAQSEQIHIIHPGFGFLAESPTFAQGVCDLSIEWIGNEPSLLARVQHKLICKKEVQQLSIPILPSSLPFSSLQEGLKAYSDISHTPCILKPVKGIHSAGIKPIWNEKDLESFFTSRDNSKDTLLDLFCGDGGYFLEPYYPTAKVIEVPYIRDREGAFKLFPPRDITIHTHFKRTVTISPVTLSKRITLKLFQFAETILQHFQPVGGGAIEFLLLPSEEIVFLEFTPRLQMNHVVTEDIMGIDLVTSQILVHEGITLGELGLLEAKSLSSIALQVRITAEDPLQQFQPQVGKITAYRQAGGFGIRVDEGNISPGSLIEHPDDPTLLFVTSQGATLYEAAKRLFRALSEFRIRGIKTNIPFLLNLLQLKDFHQETLDQNYLQEFPFLLDIKEGQDRGTKTLHLLGHIHINGFQEISKLTRKPYSEITLPPLPQENQAPPPGSKQLYQKLGKEGFCEWLRVTQTIQYTDTTLTDGQFVHLSGFFRTQDILQICPYYAHLLSNLISIEVLNSTLFFIMLRYLKESPWERLRLIRERFPNLLLQATLNASTIGAFHKLEPEQLFECLSYIAESGIDLFRLYDPFNSIETMKPAIRFLATQTNCLIDGTIGYIYEVSNDESEEMDYYLSLARRLENLGVNLLTIDDPFGKLNPPITELLINSLKEAVKIPIRLHTHDYLGNQVASYLRAIEAGIDILDVSLLPFAGNGSTPSLNGLISLLPSQHPRYTFFQPESVQTTSRAIEKVLVYYEPFIQDSTSALIESFETIIPADTYRYFQWEVQQYQLPEEEVVTHFTHLFKEAFSETPFFLSFPLNIVLTELSLNPTQSPFLPISAQYFIHSFPEQNLFPKTLGTIPYSFEQEFLLPKTEISTLPMEERLLFFMLPHDYLSWKHFVQTYGSPSPLPTPVFFGGMQEGEEYIITIAKGKTLIIKYLYSTSPDENGYRELFFELNGQMRSVQVPDYAIQNTLLKKKNASKPTQIGTPFPGIILSVFVTQGEQVARSQPLLLLSERGLQWILFAPFAGTIQQIHVAPQQHVSSNQCLIEIIPHETEK